MAQTTGRAYDDVWREKVEACLRLLRAAADHHAANRPPALDASIVAAVVARVLSEKWSRSDLDWHPERLVRPLFDWVALVGPTEAECARFFPASELVRHVQLATELRNILSPAMDAWLSGTPEGPPVEGILHEITNHLFRVHAVRLVPY
jgi:hypothetical protein